MDAIAILLTFLFMLYFMFWPFFEEDDEKLEKDADECFRRLQEDSEKRGYKTANDGRKS